MIHVVAFLHSVIIRCIYSKSREYLRHISCRDIAARAFQLNNATQAAIAEEIPTHKPVVASEAKQSRKNQSNLTLLILTLLIPLLIFDL
jgi:hypothetical protein